MEIKDGDTSSDEDKQILPFPGNQDPTLKTERIDAARDMSGGDGMWIPIVKMESPKLSDNNPAYGENFSTHLFISDIPILIVLQISM